jgi:hypothetical protein
MNAARAVDLVGGCGGPIFLRNMAKALSLFPWINTPEEDERRWAAEWALAHPKQFNAEKQRRLDARQNRKVRS